MPLTVVGISHKTAPVELREKLSFSMDGLDAALLRARQDAVAEEMTLLSTCNRTEIYVSSENGARDWCVKFLQDRFGTGDIEPYLYVKSEDDMVRHLFQVTAGLDSMVLGENEILKQVKDAYHLAQRTGLTGKLLNVLFQRALYVGKLVRTHTGLSHGAISVGSVAVSLSEKIFGDLNDSTVLIIGAGKMAEVSARYLLSRKVPRMFVANRTLENAQALARKFKAVPLGLEEGLKQMVSADIVITSVSVSEPLIGRAFIEEVMQGRMNRSLFIIDIGVPRNVDASIHDIDNVYLYDIDDLQAIVNDNLRTRQAEIRKAEDIVVSKSNEFCGWYRSVRSGEEKSMKHRADAPAQAENKA